MKKVITYGTFDVFHVGHLRVLQRARQFGDHLTVGVSTDKFNMIKGKESVFPFEERCGIIEALECVDKVIPEENWEQKAKDIKENNIDIFVMGEDWKGRFDDELGEHCEVVYLPRTEGISTTWVKEFIRSGGWKNKPLP